MSVRWPIGEEERHDYVSNEVTGYKPVYGEERPKLAEERIIDPKTGGAKGQKIERFDLIPAEALRQLALVYGGGSKKYEDDNWRKGYRWRLSLGALHRHLNLWQQGEPHDAELTKLTGEPVSHLACVMWHAAALMEFENLELGTNDIFERVGRVEAK